MIAETGIIIPPPTPYKLTNPIVSLKTQTNPPSVADNTQSINIKNVSHKTVATSTPFDQHGHVSAWWILGVFIISVLGFLFSKKLRKK
jgi:hypothetical protein